MEHYPTSINRQVRLARLVCLFSLQTDNFRLFPHQ
jgi:hypothetical protein